MESNFYEAFEKLIMDLNKLKSPTPDTVKQVLPELCRIMRVSRIVASYYQDENHEKAGHGEIYCCYDDGSEDPGIVALTNRTVTDLMTVSGYTIYMHEGARPWDEKEKQRAEMIVDTVILYMTRYRLKQMVERMTFFDDDEYHNTRFFLRHTASLGKEGRLGGKAVIQFNLKHFSLINQQIGRSSGSFVMHSYIDKLNDMLGEKGFVCRMSGDTFIILCEKSELDSVVDFLNGTAIVYDVNTGSRISVSARAGVFVIPDDFSYQTADDILSKTAIALSAAKSSSNEDIMYFSDAMISSKEKIMYIQHLFPEALKKEEFRVFYQPKIDVNTGELIGAEALCRWFHDGKIIPPLEFIPALEQGMEVCELDFYMLDHVCKDIRKWLNEEKPVVRVSVNLSRKHMLDFDLLEHIINIIDKNDVPHKYIEIELTETTTDVEFRDLKRVVRGLQQAGIFTSVDDFGMGYSSLNLIKEVPWNVVKVDRSFLPVDSDDNDSIRSIMFKYVVAMAKELGLACIAEGVETKAQVNILKNNRCDLAQGFFFDKPLPVDEFEKRISLHRYTV